jgi:hypothetical protein
MTPPTFDNFLPLQSAIFQAESWTRYLKEHWPESSSRRLEEELFASVESVLSLGIKVGEMLPLTWRLTFDVFFRTGEESWTSVPEFEAVRKDMHRLFFTVREAMDSTRQAAEALQAQTGRKPTGMNQLLQLIDDARQLQESVFRGWPCFEEPLPLTNSADSLPVDESLAQALGIPVEEARQRMQLRQRQRNAERG